MDIADYIVELLQQHEVAVVPGLGSFHTSRMEGYYNKEQQLFYPPSLQAQFSKEEHEGTDLVELIAQRRQISLASARYFIEKFVTSLKENVGTESVPLGNMGVFTTKRNELTFEPNSLNESYELYYGLAPVKLKRANAFRQEALEATIPPPRSPFFETPRVVETQAHVMPPEPAEVPAPIEEPVPAPEPAAVEAPVKAEEPEPASPVIAVPHIVTPTVQTVFVPEDHVTTDEVEYEEEKRGMSVWLILSIIIVGIGIAMIGLYKYKPELFVSILPPPAKPSAAKPISKVSATDSISAVMEKQRDSASAKPDSDVHGKQVTMATKPITPATVPVTAPLDTFGVVIATLFTPKSADIEAQRYIKKGFPQAAVRKRPNSQRAYQITIGTYFNADSAQANRLKLLERLKLASNEISVQKYPYKKP